MSRPIPEKEYQKKWINRITQWIRGEADTYLGNVEIKVQDEYVPDTKVIESHKEDQEMM